MSFEGDIDLRWMGDGRWRLMSELIYVGGEGDRFAIPAGYITDLASVPQCLQGLYPAYGAYIGASVWHDYAITHLTPMGVITGRDTDGIFRRIMKEEQVPFGRRWAMWTAVRIAALGNPDRAPGRGFLRDLPKIALVAPVALVVAAPGAIGNLISRLLALPFNLGGAK